jgi:hypothetical protein
VRVGVAIFVVGDSVAVGEFAGAGDVIAGLLTGVVELASAFGTETKPPATAPPMAIIPTKTIPATASSDVRVFFRGFLSFEIKFSSMFIAMVLQSLCVLVYIYLFLLF